MPQVGDSVYLSLQLGEGETGKYVRATVKNASNVAISGSPFTLSHVAAGLYESTSAVMPNTARLKVTYEVFEDSGFTTKTPAYELYAGESIELSEAAISQSLVSCKIFGTIKQQKIRGIIRPCGG